MPQLKEISQEQSRMAFRKHKSPQKQSTQRKEEMKIRQEIMPKKTKKSENKNRKEKI